MKGYNIAVTVPHIDPGLVIQGLRFLLDSYKLYREKFKDKETPERIEEILVKAEKAPPQTTEASDIERSIKESLDPRDAEVVKGDMEFLSLFLFPPPAIDAFDYWGKLVSLVTGLQTYASKNRLFELRGTKHGNLGQVLYLPKTSGAVLPKECAAELCIPERMQTLKSVECYALLRKEDQRFPIVVGVSADFNQYDSMGGSSLRTAQCPFGLEPGQQKHWLRFVREKRFDPQFQEGYEYMLHADDFIAIVEALRDDIREHANLIQADEQKIAPLFKSIDAFTRGVAS